MMMREGTNPTISLQEEVLKSFPPPETATICHFPCWNVYWCAAACVAAMPAPLPPLLLWDHPMEQGCAVLRPGLGWEVAVPGVCGVLHSTKVFAQWQIKGAKKQLCRHEVLVESRGKCCHGWNTPYVLWVLNAGIFACLGCISHWVMFTVTILYSSPFTELCACEHLYFLLLMAHWRCFKAFWLVSHIILSLRQDTKRKPRL